MGKEILKPYLKIEGEEWCLKTRHELIIEY